MSKKPILINIPEVIETSRLTLQMPKMEHGQRLHEAILDGYEDYIKWLCWPTTQPTLHAVEEDCCNHRAEFILRDCVRYVIIDKETNSVVGRCAYPPQQTIWAIPQFGISYFVRKMARNQGYATEATHALAFLAFRVLKAKKVEIFCDAENTASQKVAQKLGFIFECSKKGGWPRPDNQLADMQTYSCFSLDDLPTWKVKW